MPNDSGGIKSCQDFFPDRNYGTCAETYNCLSFVSESGDTMEPADFSNPAAFELTQNGGADGHQEITPGSSGKAYSHVVVLGDPHLPGRNVLAKAKTLQTVNSWEDVDLVVVLGDLCADMGTASEVEFARKFFRRLNKPVAFIHGNHDYVYCDERDASGKRVKGSAELRRYKLSRFKKTFAMEQTYYSRRCGDYLLIFLSADDLHADSTTLMSQAQLNWWQGEMSRHKDCPTAVFCHAPLAGAVSIAREGTAAIAGAVGALLMGGVEWALPAALIGDRIVRHVERREMAKPQDEIRRIIADNPQLFLWVSGHFHVAATNRNFNSIDNVFRNQVTLIHNSDMNGLGFRSPWQGWRHDRIWTNSLYFFSDRVEVKTFDHTQNVWLNNMNRTISGQKKK